MNKQRRIIDWFETYGREASILSIPELIKDFLLNEEENNVNIHLCILKRREKIPRFPYKKSDLLIFCYLNEQRIIFKWKDARCEFTGVDYGSYEEIQKITEQMENEETDTENDDGEFGFGGDWWKS